MCLAKVMYHFPSHFDTSQYRHVQRMLCTSSFIIMIIAKNHIDVVFPYTHTHTVLVHDNQICKLLYNTDTHSDTTDTRLISAHILRTELQVSMGSAAGGGLVRGSAVPRF